MSFEPSQNNPELMRLYLEKRLELVRFFKARTGSAAEAEDIVQELYFKVRKADAGHVENQVAYLYRLGLNLVLDRQRSDGRSRRRNQDYHRVNSTEVGGISTDDRPSAEDAFDARQRLDALSRAVAELPPQRRRVFQLHKIEGLSHSEVAEKLSISRSSVEKHMIAALQHLMAFRR